MAGKGASSCLVLSVPSPPPEDRGPRTLQSRSDPHLQALSSPGDPRAPRPTHREGRPQDPLPPPATALLLAATGRSLWVWKTGALFTDTKIRRKTPGFVLTQRGSSDPSGSSGDGTQASDGTKALCCERCARKKEETCSTRLSTNQLYVRKVRKHQP